MSAIIVPLFFIAGILFMIVALRKTLGNYRNNYPKFCNGDKRLGEVLASISDYKTREIV